MRWVSRRAQPIRYSRSACPGRVAACNAATQSRDPTEKHESNDGPRITSAVDLTFALVRPRVLIANVKSQTALESKFTSVPLVLTFVNELSAIAYECQNRDTSAPLKRCAASGERCLTTDSPLIANDALAGIAGRDIRELALERRGDRPVVLPLHLDRGRGRPARIHRLQNQPTRPIRDESLPGSWRPWRGACSVMPVQGVPVAKLITGGPSRAP
jgi:hypothetical protein